ncbi:MAG: hypothetical protein LBU53_09840 [Zoogloeaceae bacterium]|jgi:hypothetical protein|nr:hypothetical protein [Zoogloeaceae bacterium]
MTNQFASVFRSVTGFKLTPPCGVLATIIVALSLLVSGCATPTKMAFSDDSATTSQEISNPVFLMTVTLQNEYIKAFRPRLLVAHIEKAVVKDSADRINFTMDKKAKIESKSPTVGNTYLLRLELEQGDYVIRGFTSMARSFPFHGSFFTPLHSELQSSKPGVFYIGHVEATVRKREEGEFKAGPSIPLLDQAMIGASTGTFDISISDQWKEDEPKFRERFPALNGVIIKKAILKPFDRSKAQKWWEGN